MFSSELWLKGLTVYHNYCLSSNYWIIWNISYKTIIHSHKTFFSSAQKLISCTKQNKNYFIIGPHNPLKPLTPQRHSVSPSSYSLCIFTNSLWSSSLGRTVLDFLCREQTPGYVQGLQSSHKHTSTHVHAGSREKTQTCTPKRLSTNCYRYAVIQFIVFYHLLNVHSVHTYILRLMKLSSLPINTKECSHALKSRTGTVMKSRACQVIRVALLRSVGQLSPRKGTESTLMLPLHFNDSISSVRGFWVKHVCINLLLSTASSHLILLTP